MLRMQGLCVFRFRRIWLTFGSEFGKSCNQNRCIITHNSINPQWRVSGTMDICTRPVIVRSLVQTPLETLLIDCLSHDGSSPRGTMSFARDVKPEVPCTGSVPGTLKNIHCLIEKRRGIPDNRILCTIFGQSAIILKYEGCT